MKYSEAKACINDIGRDGLEDLIESLGEEVVEAGLALGIDPSNIEEAYQGQYSSDEDFARDMAEQLGSVDKKASWPNNCIDWEYASKELMYDYVEENGYYFRNL
jgi:antirestriction protein